MEKASGMMWSLPGMSLTLNLYIMDLSFTFMSLGLGMYSKFCLLSRIASKGLWSMTSVRLSRPRMKNLHFSRPVMVAWPSLQ